MENNSTLIGGHTLLEESKLYLIKQWAFDVLTEQSPYLILMETKLSQFKFDSKQNIQSKKINYGSVVLRRLANSYQLINRVHNTSIKCGFAIRLFLYLVSIFFRKNIGNICVIIINNTFDV